MPSQGTSADALAVCMTHDGIGNNVSFSYFYTLLVHVVCLHGCVHATAHMWRATNNFGPLLHLHEGSRDQS